MGKMRRKKPDNEKAYVQKKKTSEVGIREPEDIAVWVASTYVHSSVEVNVWVVRTGVG